MLHLYLCTATGCSQDGPERGRGEKKGEDDKNKREPQIFQGLTWRQQKRPGDGVESIWVKISSGGRTWKTYCTQMLISKRGLTTGRSKENTQEQRNSLCWDILLPLVIRAWLILVEKWLPGNDGIAWRCHEAGLWWLLRWVPLGSSHTEGDPKPKKGLVMLPICTIPTVPSTGRY